MATSTLTFKNDFDQLFRDAWWVSDPEAELKPWARETARKFYRQFGGKTDFLTIYNAILKAAAAAAAEEQESQEPTAKHTKFASDSDSDCEMTSASDEAQLAAVFKQMLQIADELAADIEQAEGSDSEASRHEHDSDYETESAEESEEDSDDYSSDSDDSEEELTVGQRRYREAQHQAKALTQQKAKATPTFAKEGEPTKAEFNAGRNEMNRLLFSEYNKWWDAFEAEADEQNDGYTAADRFSWHAAKILSRRTGLSRSQIQPVVGAWLIEHNRA